MEIFNKPAKDIKVGEFIDGVNVCNRSLRAVFKKVEAKAPLKFEGNVTVCLSVEFIEQVPPPGIGFAHAGSMWIELELNQNVTADCLAYFAKSNGIQVRKQRTEW